MRKMKKMENSNKSRTGFIQASANTVLLINPEAAPSRRHRYISCIVISLLLTISGPLTTLANTYTVSNTADAGAGSLRQAIIDANANPGADIIAFNIPAAPYKIIQASNLPPITEQVTIDGYTQPGASSGTISARTILIELETPGGIAWGLKIEASNTVVCGIAFSSHDIGTGGAVSIFRSETPATVTNNVWIWGNYFNTDVTGTASIGSGGYCINAQGNTSGAGAVSNLQNWIIGTNGDGANDDIEGNLISHPNPALTPTSAAANADPLRFFNCDNFVIAGNTFGLKKDGTTPLQTFDAAAGRNYAMALTNCTGFRIGTDGNGTSDALERNVIAGMRSDAIFITGNGPGGNWSPGNSAYTMRPQGNNTVAGNYIGTDKTGMATGTDLQNRSGVRIEGSSNNTIGSLTNAAMRNVIVNSKLQGQGIFIYGARYDNNTILATSQFNLIAGNYIGVLADGITPSGNLTGIRLNTNNLLLSGDLSVYKTTIAKNIIANNSSLGVDIRPSSSQPALVYDNTVTENSIYGNGGLGINLGSSAGDAAVTPNDGVLAAPATNNANRGMDYGIITMAGLSSDNNFLSIQGYIGNTAAGTAVFGNGAIVEFFIADNSPANQNGNIIAGDGMSVAHGEGKTYLGSLTAGADGKFTGVLDVTGKGLVRFVTQITNTATEMAATGSTSEFGANVTIANILPVRLESFTALAGTCSSIKLNWKISEAMNFRHFEIQRSINGGAFETIATTPYDGVVTSYSYIHTNLQKGQYQYRLKMVDTDGAYQYSAVAMVKLDCSQQDILVHPNPVRDIVTISGLKPGAMIQLYNTSGQLVMNSKASGYQQQISMRDKVAGTYYIVVVAEDGQKLHTAKLVKLD